MHPKFNCLLNINLDMIIFSVVFGLIITVIVVTAIMLDPSIFSLISLVLSISHNRWKVMNKTKHNLFLYKCIYWIVTFCLMVRTVPGNLTLVAVTRCNCFYDPKQNDLIFWSFRYSVPTNSSVIHLFWFVWVSILNRFLCKIRLPFEMCLWIFDEQLQQIEFVLWHCSASVNHHTCTLWPNGDR